MRGLPSKIKCMSNSRKTVEFSLYEIWKNEYHFPFYILDGIDNVGV